MKEREHLEQHLEPHLSVKERVRAIYSTLSNRDAYEIFSLAAYGINASTVILREQNFSKKRYYPRLKELLDLGLVHKDGGKYKQTTLGRTIYETQVKLLESTLEQSSATNSRSQGAVDLT